MLVSQWGNFPSEIYMTRLFTGVLITYDGMPEICMIRPLHRSKVRVNVGPDFF